MIFPPLEKSLNETLITQVMDKWSLLKVHCVIQKMSLKTQQTKNRNSLAASISANIRTHLHSSSVSERIISSSELSTSH